MLIRKYITIIIAVTLFMLLQTKANGQPSKVSEIDNIINNINIKIGGTLFDRKRQTDKVVYSVDVDYLSYYNTKNRLASIERQSSDIRQTKAWEFETAKKDYDIYRARFSILDMPTRVYIATNGVIVFFVYLN
mgnify:CR=1 FL=1